MKNSDLIYVPRFKRRGFDPQPTAGRIPINADGFANPDCIGSTFWEEFWEEEWNRCLNGYYTGGIHLTGRHYYYLNHVIITGLKGPMYPLYIDLDREFFEMVDRVKKNKKTGIISIKARRKGLSNKVQGGVVDHGIRFVSGYKAAVASGLSDYTRGFRVKLLQTMSNKPSELQLNVLKNTDDFMKIGYEEQMVNGQFVEAGALATINFATLHDSATKLEGEYFHDVVLEEAGQFPLLGKAYSSIKPALTYGEDMLGTFYIYGTGGNIKKGSAAFKEMWHEYEAFGLERLWVSGARMHFPYVGGMKNDLGENESKMPSFAKNNEFSLIGVEDVKAAEASILETRKILAKSKNKTKLVEHNQTLPLTVEEAFTSSGSNNFDNEILYDALFQVESNKDKYKDYILDFIKDKDDLLIQPLQVECREATDKDPDWKIVNIYKMPDLAIEGLDYGGVDGYNQDKTRTSKSLGAMVVLRDNIVAGSMDDTLPSGQIPIFVYNKRPPRKEMFYEICLMASVFYNLKRATMISAESDVVIDFYKENLGKKYLAKRPRSLDAPKSKLLHVFGAKMTTFSKPVMVSKLQSWVMDNAYNCVFRVILVELIAYDEIEIGTDYDVGDALGLALIGLLDRKRRPKRLDKDDLLEESKNQTNFVNGHLSGGIIEDEIKSLFGF